MLYISPGRRSELDPALHEVQMLLRIGGSEPGDLAYAVTRLAQAFLGGVKPGIVNRWKDYALVRGVLLAVSDELCRRLVAPYEDAKAQEPGDVF